MKNPRLLSKKSQIQKQPWTEDEKIMFEKYLVWQTFIISMLILILKVPHNFLTFVQSNTGGVWEKLVKDS